MSFLMGLFLPVVSVLPAFREVSMDDTQNIETITHRLLYLI